jgi:hypothetical protein
MPGSRTALLRMAESAEPGTLLKNASYSSMKPNFLSDVNICSTGLIR